MEDISMTASIKTSYATPLAEAVAKTDGTYQLHGLERAVSVLEALSESDAPLSLAEICQRMGLHKSTAHRSLMVLERSALIDRTLENRFRSIRALRSSTMSDRCAVLLCRPMRWHISARLSGTSLSLRASRTETARSSPCS